MIRTKELDKHWQGNYFCTSCEIYTGQVHFHIGHLLNYLPILCPCLCIECQGCLQWEENVIFDHDLNEIKRGFSI